MKEILQGALRSWTMWFNALMINLVWILPALESALPELKSLMPENQFAYIVVILGIGNKILRMKTSMSLADKAPLPK